MSRRKPALRIGGGVVNRNTLFDKDDTSKQGGLGLLGAYNDSDTEENVGRKPAQTQYELSVAITNLDSKVADFLKEIDELESCDSKKPLPTAEANSLQISWGDWTQCMDEKTQHPYYWNTVTNEVTWVLPSEIAAQLQKAQQRAKIPAEGSKEPGHAEQQRPAEVPQKIPNDNDNANSEHRGEKLANNVLESHQKRSAAVSIEIDVDAELEHALDSQTEIRPSCIAELDIELELLRTGLLPLSNAEEEDLLGRFEPEILKLEEEEEKNRAARTWKEYKKEIDRKKNDIMLDKTKWRAERLPVLLEMRPLHKRQEPADKVIDTNQDQHEEGASTDMVLSPVAPTIITQGIQGGETIEKPLMSPAGEHNLESIIAIDLPVSDTVGIQCDLPPEPNNAALENVSDETRDQVTDLFNMIFDKLSFLEISKKSIADFHILMIEVETRFLDWKEKALCGSYLLKKLQEASHRLKKYEETATPTGWSCHWDSTAKRYFYKNEDTGQLQWQYPDSSTERIPSKDEKESTSAAASHSVTGSASRQDDGNLGAAKEKKRKIQLLRDAEDRTKRSRSESPSSSYHEVISSKIERNELTIHSSKASNSLTTNNEILPITSSTQSSLGYPNTPQYSYVGYHGQGYVSYAGYHQYGQQAFVPVDSTPPPPPGEEATEPLNGPPPLPSEQPPPPPSPPSDPGVDCDVVEPVGDDDGIMMEMSDGEVSGDEKGGNSTAESKPAAVMSQQAVIYKPPGTVQNYMNPTISAGTFVSGGSVHMVQSFSSAHKETKQVATKMGATKPVKTKKPKKAKKSTTAKKPPKEMTSLVAQWQKAKHQMEEENRMLEEEDEEEDQAHIAKRQIEKWKQEQIESGQALNNSNFEPIPDDWRSKVLKKKTKG